MDGLGAAGPRRGADGRAVQTARGGRRGAQGAGLAALAREGSIDPSVVTQAIALHGLDTEIDDPGHPDTVPAPGSSVGWAD